ncbi:FIG00469729: hypothetical protein [hydrothermal vent metagenome]|uniref:Chemotaxis protein n=1 Tax=hydrothermal vent metagenome TaxID=652676 RepID=A0A1W1BJF2_9ZZZZ
MTQEELDALMSGGMDDLEDDVPLDETQDEEQQKEENPHTDIDLDIDTKVIPDEIAEKLPLPATDENKMVHQLDDVTKESEEKATEIFDILDNISNDMMEKEENANNILETLNENVELFTKLSAKFPEITTFQTSLEKNQQAVTDTEALIESIQNNGDSIMNIMDIMQYQDIHRQKIERVINVMRALSKYMNSLFEGKIDDEHRVSSAQHIIGDTHNEVASMDDIEALLEQFGQK